MSYNVKELEQEKNRKTTNLLFFWYNIGYGINKYLFKLQQHILNF
jgi:hypothetical protein